ncbi:MAG: acyl carrier protein [Bacteroidales bacterium]|nr:acyl carrier protein [Bacteroidales bacterium]
MMPENMFEEVQKILGKQLRRDPATVQMDSLIQKDLGADSLDILQLLMRMEDDYGIVIPDEKLAKFETVGDVVAYLETQK